ncbi:MAG: hypothetical protein GXN93_04755 [Candidatus Diapherotrites archaeon]|nr:hypothetical protein [Candidatus Diapherotrites archaeon]
MAKGKFFPCMAPISMVPAAWLAQEREDIEAIIDSRRGIVAFTAHPDPLKGVIYDLREVFA